MFIISPLSDHSFISFQKCYSIFLDKIHPLQDGFIFNCQVLFSHVLPVPG